MAQPRVMRIRAVRITPQISTLNMPLLNYTTNIDADKTAAEIARALSMHGAQAVMIEYDKEDSYIESLSFRIQVGEKMVAFRLPCDWKPVLEVLENDSKVPRARANKEQAVRTAWRIIKVWVAAQMALVETQMVSTEEVFLPYAVMPDNRTLAEHVQENPQFLLGEAKK